MAEPYYLIDSNAVIDYLGNRFTTTGMAFMNDVIDAIANVSVITKMEVLGFDAPEDDYKLLTEFMNDAVVLYLTEEIVQESIAIRKEHAIKLPDAIIAATSIVYQMELITRNSSDFKNIRSLKVVNPHLL